MVDRTADIDVLVRGGERIGVDLNVGIRDLGVELGVLIGATINQPMPADIALAFGPLVLTASLDLWVSDGGAASQLFSLDTEVSTPLILGDHLVNDPALSVPFVVTNLDTDVVSLSIGPNAVGVASIDSFVNNGDGTGSFRASFDSGYATWELSVVGGDDVDNESAESPFFIVNSIERARLGDLFTIRPQPTVWTDTCDDLIDSIPPGSFHLKRQYTVPYSYNTSSFVLSCVTPNSPVEVVVIRRGRAGVEEAQSYHVIPSAAKTYIDLRLARGTNLVTAIDQFGRSDTVIVAATTYAAVMCSYAREIYNNSQVLVDEQSNAIFSPISTRLAEPLLSFSQLLPDVRSQQTLAAKLAIRSLVSDPGRDRGVRDLLSALTLSTPIFQPNIPNPTYYEPAVYPLFHSQEHFAGVDAHVWIANQCVERWLGFVRYVTNVFQVVRITEDEVLFYDHNGDLQRHVFDLSAEECSLTTLALQSICFESVGISISIFSDSAFAICAATYPFDLRPTPMYPVWWLWDERFVELALDPGFDGYEHFSITQHWDGGVSVDSQGAVPAVGSGYPVCVYSDGYVVSPLLLASANKDLPVSSLIQIASTATPARSVEMDLLLDLAGVELMVGLDLYVQTTDRSATLNMVVEGTDEIVVGLGVVVSS